MELQGELENARVVRLMTKLGFINERPEYVLSSYSYWDSLTDHAHRFAREPRWSETGDRYIIKLFRDFVFHQVDEHGNPVLDMSHVMTCLNKVCSLDLFLLVVRLMGTLARCWD
jgi:PAB-dependent poly(A)-specific ribonuclease subunit 3